MSKRKNKNAREKKRVKAALIEKAIRKRFKREIPMFFDKIKNQLVTARCPVCFYICSFSKETTEIERVDDLLSTFKERVGCTGCGRLFNGLEDSEVQGRMPTLIFIPKAYISMAQGYD